MTKKMLKKVHATKQLFIPEKKENCCKKTDKQNEEGRHKDQVRHQIFW